MKKFLSILTIALALIVTSAQSQTFVRLNQGGTNDTLIASKTLYSSIVNLNFAQTQAVSVGVAVDSISGAPAGSFILQHSVDGVHWNTYLGDTVSYTNTGWNIAGAGSSGDTRSYLSLKINQAPFYGTFARVKITTTSAARRSRYWISLRSSNYRN